MPLQLIIQGAAEWMGLFAMGSIHERSRVECCSWDHSTQRDMLFVSCNGCLDERTVCIRSRGVFETGWAMTVVQQLFCRHFNIRRHQQWIRNPVIAVDVKKKLLPLKGWDKQCFAAQSALIKYATIYVNKEEPVEMMSDEAHFHLCSSVNKQTCRYCPPPWNSSAPASHPPK